MESILTAWEDNMGGCGEGKVPFFCLGRVFSYVVGKCGKVSGVAWTSMKCH